VGVYRHKQLIRALNPNFQGVEFVPAPVDDDLVVRLQIAELKQDALDLGGKDIDSAHDEHIVGAAQYLVHADDSAAAGTWLGVKRGAVAGAVADEGHRFFGQGGKDQFAFPAVAQRLAAGRIDHFGVKMVLKDMETGMCQE